MPFYLDNCIYGFPFPGGSYGKCVVLIHAMHMQMLWPLWVVVSADTRTTYIPGFIVYVFVCVKLLSVIWVPGQFLVPYL